MGARPQKMEPVVEVRELEGGAGAKAAVLGGPVVRVPLPLVEEPSAHGRSTTPGYMKQGSCGGVIRGTSRWPFDGPRRVRVLPMAWTPGGVSGAVRI